MNCQSTYQHLRPRWRSFRTQHAEILFYKSTKDGLENRKTAQRFYSPKEILHYWTYRECISLENGLLFKDNRLIVPKVESDQILELLHYGHYGINCTQDRASIQGKRRENS